MEQFESQRQTRAEVVTRFINTAKGIEALKGKSVSEIFSNEQSVRDLITGLSDKQFVELLNGLNGIIRGAKKKDWTMTKHQMEISGAMESETVFTPSLEDRAALTHQMINAAKEMNKSGRSMEDIALLVSVTMNAIHPWEDANGRTSRLVYALLAEGYTPETKERISRLMSEEGSDDLATDIRHISGDLDVVIRTEHELDFSNLFSDIPTKQFVFADDVTEIQKSELIRAYKADSFTHLAIAVGDFLRECDDKIRYYREFPNDRKVVMFDELIANLSGKDIEEILKKYSRIKARKVELLIDCINHPSKKEFQIIARDGVKISMMEKLKKGVKKS